MLSSDILLQIYYSIFFEMWILRSVSLNESSAVVLCHYTRCHSLSSIYKCEMANEFLPFGIYNLFVVGVVACGTGM